MIKKNDSPGSDTPHPARVSLVTYQALVDRCARERLNYDIANGSALHARILIAKLFEIARREVCIVSGSIRQNSPRGEPVYAYARLIDNAKAFLTGSDTTLTVVALAGETDGGDQNAFLQGVINDPSRRGTVEILFPKKNVFRHEETPHFMVSDGEAYRFETSTDADPRNESVTAIANFGDFPTGHTLREIFGDVMSLIDADDNLATRRVFRTTERLPA